MTSPPIDSNAPLDNDNFVLHLKEHPIAIPVNPNLLYVKGRDAEWVERDFEKAIRLYRSSIYSPMPTPEPRFLALKEMTILLKHLDRTDAAVKAATSYRDLSYSRFNREDIDDLFIALNKEGTGEARGNTIAGHIELLEQRIQLLEQRVKPHIRTKNSAKEGYDVIRLKNELCWFDGIQGYTRFDRLYRNALYVTTDKNSQCKSAILLIGNGCVSLAMALLQAIQPSSEEFDSYIDSSEEWDVADSYIDSYNRACEMLTEVLQRWNPSSMVNHGPMFSGVETYDISSQVQPFYGADVQAERRSKYEGK